MVQRNGYIYSKKPFEGYKFRAKFEFYIENEKHCSNIDIYTDDPVKSSVEWEVCVDKSEKIKELKIVHWTTREQDELNSKFLDEFLN